MARTTPVPLAAPPSAAPPRTGIFAAFATPAYGRLWLSGGVWNATRWMSIFLGSYLVDQFTGSPFLVQLVGAAFFAPMFLGGVFAGAIADRFDRRRTILRQLLVLIPVAVLMGVLVLGDRAAAWMVYPFMVAVGIGGVVDMTSRRALVYDMVGERLAANALALESLSMAAGSTLGALFGGAVINFVGVGEAFLLIAALYGVAFVLLAAVPRSPPRAMAAPASIRRDLTEGIRAVRRSDALIGVLGVTVIFNLFYFSFMPLIPVFARGMEVNALLAGVLAAATGFGMMAGSILLAGLRLRRRGLLYVLGSAAALLFLAAFALLPWYPLALLLLAAAGVCSAAFATMQGVLVMEAAGPEMRGRAMGVLSMAIGSLPFGMIGLGLVAQATSPSVAVVASVVLGMVTLALWLMRYPAVSRLP